ncbi:peptidase M23-like protein [Neolewinella xylanilytica]|uniref:Peptidase M23-like protein n=1 Tax=Neolewinella xylanilytica TaxID=1514080 RepID=A0A2S6IAN5_9BACT|nr:M23 family metallopeptidase [Neolewinella xylanilytica]PPK88563.1 peptidase M23-like protein [Neolewinella xylanilytica]
MLTKMLVLEAVVICGLLAFFVHRQLPATELTVGDRTFVIKEEPIVATEGTVPLPDDGDTPGGLTFPVAGFGTAAVISVFGDRRGSQRLHEGIDIKAPKGTPVVAVTDGFVERINSGGSGGRQLYLRDVRGRLYYYAHLDEWRKGEFDAVSAGDTLATVGDTGNAQGTTPHLHFEVLVGKRKSPVDPLRYWSLTE